MAHSLPAINGRQFLQILELSVICCTPCVAEVYPAGECSVQDLQQYLVFFFIAIEV